MVQSGSLEPESKDVVSIFFANIFDYPVLRHSLQPNTMCSLLARLFAKLDSLAGRHAVQRVDAIDGCYIAATNFSYPQRADHALRLARFAVDAIAAVNFIPIDEDRPELGTVRLQAGLHCGAVCGCMLGAHGGRKYTLVGDAVNVASRMESQGAAGAVQCSGAFAAEMGAEGSGGCLAQPELTRRAGGLDVKGKGHMEAFWVSAECPSPAVPENMTRRQSSAKAADCCPAGPACCSPCLGSVTTEAGGCPRLTEE